MMSCACGNLDWNILEIMVADSIAAGAGGCPAQTNGERGAPNDGRVSYEPDEDRERLLQAP